MLLSLISWVMMIARNLDTISSIVVLFIATAFIFAMNLKGNHLQDAFNLRKNGENPFHRLNVIDVFYTLLIIISFYLLFLSLYCLLEFQ